MWAGLLQYRLPSWRAEAVRDPEAAIVRQDVGATIGCQEIGLESVWYVVCGIVEPGGVEADMMSRPVSGPQLLAAVSVALRHTH